MRLTALLAAQRDIVAAKRAATYKGRSSAVKDGGGVTRGSSASHLNSDA